MSKITEQVEVIVKPIMEDLNFELVDVEYVKEGRDHFLRISIDKEGGVDLNDCTLVPEMYYLDVASPGAERPIKKEQDFQNAITKPVFVSLYVPIEGEKEWLGILQEVNNETIVVQVKIKARTKDIEIPRDKIAKARHAVMI